MPAAADPARLQSGIATPTSPEDARVVLDRLRSRAAAGPRSLNSELLTILEAAAGNVEAGAAPDASADVGAVHEAAPAYGVAESADVLADVDRAALADICRHHHIRRLDVFGSGAAGTARPDRAVHLIAEFEPGRTPGYDIVRGAEALRPVFGGRRADRHTPFEVRRLSDRMTPRTLYAAAERVHLEQMVHAARGVSRLARERDRRDFDDEEVVRLASLHLIQRLREAASRLTADFRAAHPEHR